MNTIRRIYVYVVCFVSLQLLTGAVNAMVGGVLRQALLPEGDDLSFLIFQIAIIVVSGPIYLGHWLWAQHAARTQADEPGCAPRRFYLYATASVFLLYVIVAAFNGLQALLSFIFPPEAGTFLTPPTPAENWATIINSAVTVLATGILWFYHRAVTDSDERATPEASQGALGAFRDLYLLGFSTLGAICLSIGLYGVTFALLDFPESQTLADLSSRIPLLVLGAAIFAPFQYYTLTEAQANTGWRSVLRWLYATGFSFVGLALAFFGLFALQVSIFYRLDTRADNPLPFGVAALLSGLPLLIYHEVLLHRTANTGLHLFRWLYGLLIAGLSLALAIIGSVAAWQAVFNRLAGVRAPIPEAAALLLAGLLAWAYHHFAVMRPPHRIGLFHRLYQYGYSGLALNLTALGLIGVQEWLYSRFIGQGVAQLPDALALLITGLPLWLRYWSWANRQFIVGGEPEQKSDLRKAYLYLVIFAAVSAVVITAALLINGVLRTLLGLPTEGGLGLPLAIILAAAALWAYHAFVLRSDIARAGESKLQAGMQRLYWYVIAFVGLAAFTLGLAGDISVLVRALGTRSFPEDLRAQLAGFSAAWLAGLPVWLIGWVPAQSLAARPTSAGADARRSLLRKAYLYLYWLASILTLLGSAITIVFLGLSALFGLLAQEDIAETLTNLGQAIGFATIALGVWLYHFFLLRRDGAYARQEQQAAAQQTAAEWESLRVVIAAPVGAPFEQAALEQLGRELPHLKPAVVQLPAAEGSAEDTAARLSEAQLIIAPWALAAPGGPLAAFAAPKVIVLTQTTGLRWLVAASSAAVLGSQLAGAIRQAAPELKSAAPPVEPQAGP